MRVSIAKTYVSIQNAAPSRFSNSLTLFYTIHWEIVSFKIKGVKLAVHLLCDEATGHKNITCIHLKFPKNNKFANFVGAIIPQQFPQKILPPKKNVAKFWMLVKGTNTKSIPSSHPCQHPIPAHAYMLQPQGWHFGDHFLGLFQNLQAEGQDLGHLVRESRKRWRDNRFRDSDWNGGWVDTATRLYILYI